jgi:hypothetical protein
MPLTAATVMRRRIRMHTRTRARTITRTRARMHAHAQSHARMHACTPAHAYSVVLPGTRVALLRLDSTRRLCEPYLRAEYGEEFDFKAPVKLLDKWLHGLPSEPGEQVIVLSQVLAADVRRPHHQQR